MATFGRICRSRLLVIFCASVPLSFGLMGTTAPALGKLDDVAAAEFAVQTLKPLSSQASARMSARAGTGRRMDMTDQVALLPVAPARAAFPLLVARGKGAASNDGPLRIRGMVGQSLYRSARTAGAPISAVQEYLRALNQYVSLSEDVHPGDEFDMVLAPDRGSDDGSGNGSGSLLYASLIRDGKPFKELLRWGADGQFQAADGEASAVRQPQVAMFMAPVAGRITSGFGMRRHPILGFARLHAGMDFGAAWGTPIHAVNDGAVSFAGYSGGHGNMVRLDHGGGIGTGYAHMSRIAVSPGERVRKGQVIGYVGSTGLSTGPHLHYELYHNGRPVNPAAGVGYVMQSVASPAQSAAFRARLAQLQAVKPL